MNTKQLKKQLILNIPYIILGLLATNLVRHGELQPEQMHRKRFRVWSLMVYLQRLFLILCRAFIRVICWWELPAGQHSGLQYT